MLTSTSYDSYYDYDHSSTFSDLVCSDTYFLTFSGGEYAAATSWYNLTFNPTTGDPNIRICKECRNNVNLKWLKETPGWIVVNPGKFLGGQVKCEIRDETNSVIWSNCENWKQAQCLHSNLTVSVPSIDSALGELESQLSSPIYLSELETNLVLLEFSPETELFRKNLPLIACERALFNTYCANRMSLEITNTIPDFEAVCIKKSDVNECTKMAITDTKGDRSIHVFAATVDLLY